MFYLNEARIAGNLGADAEVKTCANGAVQFRFRLCTDKEWHSVECYAESEKAAAFLASALVKGALVYAEGSIQTDTWVDKGVKRSWKKIKAHRCQIISIPAADGGMETGADFNPDVPPELTAPAPSPAPPPPPAPTPAAHAAPPAPAPAPAASLRERFRNLAR